MKHTKSFLIKLALVLLIASFFAGLSQNGFAQSHPSVERRQSDLNFFFDLVTVNSPKEGFSKINIYIKIAYDELQFVVHDSIYNAEYELGLVIFDDDDNQVDGEIIQEKITAESYETTNSKELYSLSHTSFDLRPGKYKIVISITDIDTRNTVYQKASFEVRGFGEKDLELSDITIVNKITVDSLGVKSIRPEIASHINEKQRLLFAFYEIYSKLDVDSFDVNYVLRSGRGSKIENGTLRQHKQDNRTLAYVSIDAAKMSHGRYSLEVTVNDGSKSVQIDKNFIIRWLGIPAMIVDIDLAIEQLKYIASSSEMKRLKNAKDNERLVEFEKFWKSHDPTPGTKTNEHMEEYFRRIGFANESFSGFQEGWRSDMGMVYIIFGQPSEIERHPFESGYKPFEIWYYHELNRRFVFIDETGFGEYRLSTGSWQDWQRNYWRP
ncbi:GWxTD domain-containing protein [candidate division KSB1 bacterium]|nr:GWxTD domain-containing protein [candidate division KSB1 bacterium]